MRLSGEVFVSRSIIIIFFVCLLYYSSIIWWSFCLSFCRNFILYLSFIYYFEVFFVHLSPFLIVVFSQLSQFLSTNFKRSILWLFDYSNFLTVFAHFIASYFVTMTNVYGRENVFFCREMRFKSCKLFHCSNLKVYVKRKYFGDMKVVRKCFNLKDKLQIL